MNDWTHGAPRLVYQQCPACAHRFYFQRGFCPACGRADPPVLVASGDGVVHAATLVQRAPSDEFRAIVPYGIVLVNMAEGFRVMGHGDPALAIGDEAHCEIRTIAGRPLPYFHKGTHAA